jgi:phosphatidylglycerophosphatase A
MTGTDINTFDRAAEWIWSLGKLGFIPIYHSFWGALIGLPLYALFFLLGWKAYLTSYVLLFVLGWLVVSRSLVYYGKPKQDHRVIIDKTLGYLTAMFLAPQYLFLKFPYLWGFFIFLAIDMVKPWFIAKVHDKQGSIFILLDDILAGLVTCLLLWVVAVVHYLFINPMIMPAIFAR